MERIKVLVADDHVLVREGIVALLSNLEEIELLGEASNGKEVIKLIADMEIDVVVMDIMMPFLNGFETTKFLKEEYPSINILLVSMDVSSEYISNAINCGASGYLPKDCKKSVLIEGVKKVASGERYFNHQITEVIFDEFYIQSKTGKRKETRKSDEISKRELEVLRLISLGQSNRDIADQLFISIRTVDAHRNHIMKKIKAKSTADLVKYAIKNEIVEI